MSNYFGSDLNKFIAEHCEHKFTTINIDCLCLKWETKTLRIIEAKHNNEPLGLQQIKALNFLSARLGCLEFNGWAFEAYITRGDYPYDILVIFDLIRGRFFKIMGQDNVINWLSFKVNLLDISEEVTLSQNSFYQRLSI